MKKIICVFYTLLLTSLSIFCDFNKFGIPDSSKIRSTLNEKWFLAPLENVRENKPEIFYNEIGEEFQVRMEEDDDFFYIFVSPKKEINVTFYTEKKTSVKKQIIYPGDALGSTVLVKDKKNSKPITFRYYFIQNSEIYLQFTPQKKTALIDLVIFGNYAAKGVPSGLSFEYFLQASFNEIYKITENKIPWQFVFHDSQFYNNVKQMIGVIRERLPQMNFTTDSMYNENNELISIFSGKPYDKIESIKKENKNLYLSSAGFQKWIADGLVEPLSGGKIKREPLMFSTVESKSVGLQGILSEKYNINFALDWIRNLASAVISVYTGKTYVYGESGVDVTFVPFSSKTSNFGSERFVSFVENSGYTTSVLKSLLFVLSAIQPDTFYFGAIRQTDRTVTPEVKVFNDCVTFFPYMNADGNFECSVFMNCREMNLDDFCLLFSEDFVYLTKVKASSRFFPD